MYNNFTHTHTHTHTHTLIHTHTHTLTYIHTHTHTQVCGWAWVGCRAKISHISTWREMASKNLTGMNLAGFVTSAWFRT